LKQASRVWYAKIANVFLQLGVKHFESSHSLYVLHPHGKTLIISIHVDEIFIIEKNTDLILRLKKQLVDSFDMTNLGILHYFLGFQILPFSSGLLIYQYKYVMYLITCFNMDDCKSCDTPFQFTVKIKNTCQAPKVDATLY
jgi:hypothetical protein